MKSPKPLDRYYLTFAQHRLAQLQQFGASRLQAVARGVRQVQFGAAGMAGDGFGMKSSVARVLIFGPAIGAHRKVIHRRVRSVIRYVFNYSEARATVGAVDEWIPKTPVLMIEQFPKTVLTRSHIRGDGQEPVGG